MGSKSLNADRYIQWNDLSYPNFHEPDVKGADTKTSLGDLRQCENWATDYLQEYSAKAKGVFIPNQYRREEYPDYRTNSLDILSIGEVEIMN